MPRDRYPGHAAEDANAPEREGRHWSDRAWSLPSWREPAGLVRSLHHVKQAGLLLRRDLRPIGFFKQRIVESLCSLSQRFAMQRVRWWKPGYGARKLLQDIREQPVMKMHVNGLALFGLTRALEAQ